MDNIDIVPSLYLSNVLTFTWQWHELIYIFSTCTLSLSLSLSLFYRGFELVLASISYLPWQFDTFIACHHVLIVSCG